MYFSLILGNADFWVRRLWVRRDGSRSFAGFVCLVWLPAHKKEIEGSFCSFEKSSCKVKV